MAEDTNEQETPVEQKDPQRKMDQQSQAAEPRPARDKNDDTLDEVEISSDEDPFAKPVEPLESSRYYELRSGPYNPDQHRDWVRSVVTYAFVGILAITLLATLAIVIWDSPGWASAKDFLQIVLPTETALVGSVVGFYFGSQSRRDPR